MRAFTAKILNNLYLTTFIEHNSNVKTSTNHSVYYTKILNLLNIKII